MVLAIGVNYSGAVTFTVGTATISLSGLAVAAITGIALNAILPGKGLRVRPRSEGRHRCQLQGLIHQDPARSSRRPARAAGVFIPYVLRLAALGKDEGSVEEI